MSINMLSRFMALEQTIFQIMETLEFLFQSGYWMINYQNDNQRPWLYPIPIHHATKTAFQPLFS